MKFIKVFRIVSLTEKKAAEFLTKCRCILKWVEAFRKNLDDLAAVRALSLFLKRRILKHILEVCI